MLDTSANYKANTIFAEAMRPYVENDVERCAEAGALLLFLALTEAKMASLGKTVPADDQIEQVASILKNVPQTTYITKEGFAQIAARRAEALEGDAGLISSFVMQLPDTSISTAAQIYGRHNITEWDKPAIAALSRLFREALMKVASNYYAYPLLPDLADALVQLGLREAGAMQVNARQAPTNQTDLRICIPWVGIGRLMSAANAAGLTVDAFSNDVRTAALVSLHAALESDEFNLGKIIVGTPEEDSYDLVLVSEQDWTLSYRASMNKRTYSAEPVVAGGKALREACNFAKEDGGVVVGITSNRMTYGERFREGRKTLVESGLAVVCEIGSAPHMDEIQRCISVVHLSADDTAPILLASTSGEAGQKNHLDISSRFSDFDAGQFQKALHNTVDLIANRQVIDYVSLLVDRNDVIENEDVALRFTSYSASVDVYKELAFEGSWENLAKQAEASRKAVSAQEEKFEQVLNKLHTMLES